MATQSSKQGAIPAWLIRNWRRLAGGFILLVLTLSAFGYLGDLVATVNIETKKQEITDASGHVSTIYVPVNELQRERYPNGVEVKSETKNYLSAYVGLLLGLTWVAIRHFMRRGGNNRLVLGVLLVLLLMSSGFWPLSGVAGILLGIGLGGFIFAIAVGSGGGASKKKTTFGSAEWANLTYLQTNGLLENNGYILGYFQVDDRPYPIYYNGDRHLLTVAPTRAGKGVAAIIPNLLTHRGSAFVIDPKGENAMITARQRRALGQTVHVLDPWGVTEMKAATFNPLEWLKTDDPDVGENALMLADAMITKSGGDSSFWDEEAVALLWGLILFVALDLESGMDRSLGGVRDLINLGPRGLENLLGQMKAHPNGIVNSTAERTLAKEAAIRNNVFTTLQSHTHFLDSPKIRASLATSSFKFEDLKTTQMTVYLVLPADRLQPFGRWLRLLVQQAITVNARNIKIKPAGGRPILFLLDEMAALGKLTKVEEAYGLMAGFGMQLWGIVQDLSQLDRIYDKGWETFIGNSGVLQYFGSRDVKTAEYFSKLCGVSTIEKRSVSTSISRSLGFGRTSGTSSSGTGENRSKGANSSTSDSTTTSETADVIQRPLIFPDELMVLRKSQGLLLVENFNPIDSRKIEWFSDERLHKLGDDPRKQPSPLPVVQSERTPATAPSTVSQTVRQLPPGDVRA